MPFGGWKKILAICSLSRMWYLLGRIDANELLLDEIQLLFLYPYCILGYRPLH